MLLWSELCFMQVIHWYDCSVLKTSVFWLELQSAQTSSRKQSPDRWPNDWQVKHLAMWILDLWNRLAMKASCWKEHVLLLVYWHLWQNQQILFFLIKTFFKKYNFTSLKKRALGDNFKSSLFSSIGRFLIINFRSIL